MQTNAADILVVGDPHFKINNTSETDLMEKSLLSLLSLRTPDLIVVLGDTLDRHESIHVNPLTRAVSFLHSLSHHANVVLLIGNHDRRNNSDYLSDEHPFTALSLCPGFTVVDNPKSLTIKGMSFVFVPYVPPGLFEKALDLLSWKGCRCIFAHQELHGVKLTQHFYSQEGDKWPTHYPLVVSGHIHDYQRPQDNILYVGSPFQHDIAAAPDKTVSWIRFTPSTWTEERVPLGIPYRRRESVTYQEFQHYIAPEDVRLHLLVSGSPEEIAQLRQSDKYRRFLKKGVKIHTHTNYPSLPIVPQERKGYISLLSSRLQDKPHLVPLLKELFG
jgi:hypothetical protein